MNVPAVRLARVFFDHGTFAMGGINQKLILTLILAQGEGGFQFTCDNQKGIKKLLSGRMYITLGAGSYCTNILFNCTD
jgi:hypothetical protein